MYTECRVIVHISIQYHQYHRPNSVRRCWNIKLRIFLLTRSDLKVATTKKFATGSFHQLSVPSPDPREQEQIVHEPFWTVQGFICQLRRSWTVHYPSAFYLENQEASTTIQNKCRNPFDHRTILVHRLIFCADQPWQTWNPNVNHW